LSYALVFAVRAGCAYSLARQGSIERSAAALWSAFVQVPAAAILARRAARSRAKSSPAWCDERVNGVDDTSRKPLAAPIVA